MNPTPLRPLAALFVASLAASACDCGGGVDPETSIWKTDAGVPPCTPPFVGAGTVLASGLDGPRKLATDGTHLYFTEAGGVATGRVSRTPLNPDGGVPDGGLIETLATGFTTADAIAVDDQYVYLLDEEGLWRVNKASNQVTKLNDLASNALIGESAIRIHGDSLLIATGLEWLVRIQKDGTGRTFLHSATAGAAVRAAAIDGTDVYFLVSGTGSAEAAAGLYRIPIDGSALAVRISPTPLLGRDLAITPSAYVWTEGSAARDGAIRARSRVDGGIFTYADQLWAPSAPVVVDRYVYFQAQTDPSPSNPPSELFFRMASECDPLGAPLVGATGFGPGDLLLHDGALYFTSLGVAGQGYVGKLR